MSNILPFFAKIMRVINRLKLIFSVPAMPEKRMSDENYIKCIMDTSKSGRLARLSRHSYIES